MPRTTKKPKPNPVSPPKPQPASANGPAGDVLTLVEAAAYLRLPENEVIAAASTQGLPGRLIGTEWRFSKPAILQWLNVSQPTAEMRKAATLAMIGKYKDDAGWEELREEIARQRERLQAEVER